MIFCQNILVSALKIMTRSKVLTESNLSCEKRAPFGYYEYHILILFFRLIYHTKHILILFSRLIYHTKHMLILLFLMQKLNQIRTYICR